MAAGSATQQRRTDGLDGPWLSLDEVAELEFFKSGKRAFRIKLNANFAPVAGEPEPGIKAAVRREYNPGDIICRAGEYGSTAFLLLEGTATATVPARAKPARIAGRTKGSLARLADLFRRRRRSADTPEPDLADLGEVSLYGSLQSERAAAPVTMRPGDVFGIDTCINFYPREVTVQAEERCVVLEMLRSVLDSVRDAGAKGDDVDHLYRAGAIAQTVRTHPLFAHLDGDDVDQLAAAATLLTQDSEGVREGVLYVEQTPADALFLVRAGTIKLSQRKAGGELVFAYLGRSAAFGLEQLVPTHVAAPLLLRCTSHPNLFPPVTLHGSLTVGRGAGSDIRLPADDRAVGRKHCRLEERDGEVYLLDLDSANYTILNGERIREAIVADGDRITIVDYTLEVGRAPSEIQPAVTRVATATGLDSFEVVRIGVDALSRLRGDDARLSAAARRAALASDARAQQLSAAEQALLADVVDLNLYNSQNTLLIDLDRCTRCDECVRACADAHGGVARFTRDGPRIGHYLVTLACRSCTDPKCMVGCPVGSIRRLDSLQIRIEDWCIGCERCANQCPFGNINMVEVAPAAPAATALLATVCDLCAGYDGPNCVYACPHDAAIRVNPAAFLTPADRR